MILGVDYYPEHWPESMRREDLARMKATGVNTIRIGEFAWHMMEPQEGRYDFSFFDGVIEDAKATGLNVIFGTPTATFPAWLAYKYPEILAETTSGRMLAFGGRREYCYNSVIYREKASQLVRELVKHYRDESAIVAWQIDNELGHEGSDQCYCSKCHERFQRFLQRKYGKISELNQRYGTIFWGQSYNDFYEIPLPTQTITIHNPSLVLDWMRFRSESLIGFAREQIKVVRALKGDHQQIMHNLYGGFFDRAFDQTSFSEYLDVVGYDHYPVWGGLKAPISPAHNTLSLNYMYGLKKQPFWVVEEIMGAQGHDYIGYLPRPNEALMWSLHAMAHGSEAMMFFRWRGMTKGAEQFCQGILDPDNRDNAKLDEVCRCFETLKRHEAVFKAKPEAEIALYYDFDNRWSWHHQPQSDAFNYTGEMVHVFDAFYRHNVEVAVERLPVKLGEHRVILLPILQIMDDAFIHELERFIKAGGIVILGFRSGIKDRDNNLTFGLNRLYELCGIEIKGFESLGIGISYPVVDDDGSVCCQATVGRDLVYATTSEALWHYGDVNFESYAAVTVRALGKGRLYYVGTHLEADAMRRLAMRILKEAEIATIETPEGVECSIRGEARLWINHTGLRQEVGDIRLEPFEVKVQ